VAAPEANDMIRGRWRRHLPIIFAAIAVAGAHASASAQDWQAGAGPDWQRVLADAKAEGHVAVVGPPELGVPIADAFLRDTGIEVDYLGGVASANGARVTREAHAGSVTIDVMFTGTAELPLAKQGLLADESARLILPGAADPKNWRDGTLKWVDNDKKYMLQTQASVTSTPFYDTNSIKPGELTSWRQLLDPQFKGKIVAYDPRSGGPGQQMVGYIGALFGIDFLKSLYLGQQVTYSQDSRQMSEWLARSVDWVALGMLATDYERLRNAGITTIAVADMKDGPGTLSGGFSVILEPKGSPHPNAATVFLNWIASGVGQQVYSHVEGQLSRRIDVHDASVLDFMVPKPGKTYLDQYNEDWALNQRAKIIDAVLQALGGK
jgi:ABC-type Fe3+ transport system substrate-binding protein